MVCHKCGRELPENTRVCPSCGEALEIPAERSEQQIAPETVTEQTTVTPDVASAPAFNLNTKGEVKKKNLLVPILIGAGVLLIALAVFVIVNFKSWFGKEPDPREQLNDTLMYRIDSLLDDGSSIVGDLNSFFSQSQTIEGNLTTSIDESVMPLISSLGVLDDELLNILNSFSANYKLAIDENKLMLSADCLVDDQKRMTVTCIMDMATGEIWVSVPELHEKAIHITNASQYGGSPMAALDIMDELLKSEKFRTVLHRYLQLYTDAMATVEEKTETVTVNGISQQLLVIECRDTEENMMKTSISIMEKMKTDEDVKALIEQLEIPGGNDGVYEEFLKTVDKEIERMKNEDADSEGEICLKLYLSEDESKKDGKIAGFSVKTDDPQESVAWLSATDGSKTASRFTVDTAEIIYTAEQNTENKTNGNIEIVVEEESLLQVAVNDFSKTESGVSGTFTLKLGPTVLQAIMDAMFADMNIDDAFLKFADPAIRIELSGTKEKTDISLTLVMMAKDFFTLDSHNKKVDPIKITVPTACVEASDKEAMEKWYQEAGFR